VVKANMYVTKGEPNNMATAVEIKDGMQVAFEKQYFYERILCMTGQGLKAIFSKFEIVIEGTTTTEVFVRFQEKK
jgi:hypothetical protein